METLLNAPTGKSLRIVQIKGGHGIRRHLARLAISENSTIQIERNAPFSGPLVIKINGAQTAIGRGIAAKIFVEVVK